MGTPRSGTRPRMGSSASGSGSEALSNARFPTEGARLDQLAEGGAKQPIFFSLPTSALTKNYSRGVTQPKRRLCRRAQERRRHDPRGAEMSADPVVVVAGLLSAAEPRREVRGNVHGLRLDDDLWLGLRVLRFRLEGQDVDVPTLGHRALDRGESADGLSA